MTPKASSLAAATLAFALCAAGCAQNTEAIDAAGLVRADERRGWLSWRGPNQNGTSPETGLPERISMDPSSGSWTYPLAGRGTPVIVGDRVYALGYEAEGSTLQEILVCLEAASGRKVWEHRVNEFLTDIIYHRFSIGSPTIDAQTGNVFWLSTAGLLSSFAPDGALRWQHSLMSEYGRLTFPNGRTGAPVIDGDLAIVHVATSAWGKHAPARDRFYAFDKNSGDNVWSCTPGGPPKDASFSFPVLDQEHGKRVMYAGLAGGHLVCVDVRTGDPLWRFQMSVGGMSSSPVLYKDSIIAIHGKENLDSSKIGRMIALRRGSAPAFGEAPVVLDKAAEVWRNDIVAFTSSPILVGNRVYQTVATGDLCCVDADSGEILWEKKLAPDQIHASPVWADGRLYVPMNNGTFHVVEPSDAGAEVLQTEQLEGNCLGAPAIADGRIYVHTTDRLYCFAGGSGKAAVAQQVLSPAPAPPIGAAVRLQVVPADLVVRPGDKVSFGVRSLDANGRRVSRAVDNVVWSGVPIGASIADGVMTVATQSPPSATVVKAVAGDLEGSVRLRIVPGLPYRDDFDDVALKPHAKEPGVLSAPPRPYWVGAGLKWEFREVDGEKVLAKTLDRPLFQRTMSMIGHPAMSGYTMQIDGRTDGNRRIKGSVGLVNQRYLVLLKGNYQQLEVSSNQEVLKESVPFEIVPKAWYTLKARVDVANDGTGVIRAKAWPRGEAEPADWTIEVEHRNAHTHGSPGLYGFTPQSRFRVYIDNVSVTPND